jgi:hypothetical protein
MPFFTRVFRSKDSNAAKKSTKTPVVENTGPAKPTWTDAWQRTEVAPEEVQDLLRGCTQELKARGTFDRLLSRISNIGLSIAGWHPQLHCEI